MESNYRNREFEQQVKQNADQYRMFPSEKVWKNIHNALHTRRKWYGIGLASLLLLTGTAVTLVMISYPSSKKQDGISLNTSPEIKPAPVVINTPVDNKTILPFNGQVADQSKPLFQESVLSSSLIAQNNNDEMDLLPGSERIHSFTNDREQPVIINETKAAVTNSVMGEYIGVIDDQVEQNTVAVADKKVTQPNNIIYPLTIESITNSYQPKKSKKLSWEFFVTPTISYRKLNTNKSFDNSSITNYPFANLASVNSAVIHKPDFGLQIGTSVRYPITKNLKLRGGLQFNVNKYDIKAYTYNPEIVTINLSDANGNRSLSTWTYYRNYSGYKSNWLKNYYFSVSVPIGIEMKLLGNNKTSFGVAGTIQPTYIIKDKAYLISTDYKNYAKVPSLVRHLNANAGFEAFVNYTKGKTRWQIGPQARYQILSSFQNTYPVKEHLFDFGVRLGVYLNE